MKKNYILSVIFILFIAFLTLTLFFTPGSDIQKEQKRIVFVTPQMDYPIWLQTRDGFFKAADEYGFHGIWAGSENCNIDDMIKEIDSAIYEHADAIITCPLTPNKFTAIFKKAASKNIPLITAAVDAESEDLRTAYVGSCYEELGRAQANALHDQVGDNMKIGVLMSGLTVQNQVIQLKQLEDLVNTLPGSSIVDIREDLSDPIVGMHALTNMLNAHPQINAIFATAGGAIGSYGKILKEKDLSSKITLIGMDTIQDNIDAIKNGSIYGVMSQDYYYMGYLSGKYALDTVQGKNIPNITYTDSELITIDNIDSLSN